MKKLISLTLCFSLTLSFTFLPATNSWAKSKYGRDSGSSSSSSSSKKRKASSSIKVNNQIQANIYSYRRTKYFTAVEVGFTNTSNQYASFRPKSLKLSDGNNNQVRLLTEKELADIEFQRQYRGNVSIVPWLVSAGLGIATSIAYLGGASGKTVRGLGMASIIASGVFLISATLESVARHKQLIVFRNNSISGVKSIPPQATVGGFLYFPAITSPSHLVLTHSGSKKDVLSLKKVKKSRFKKVKQEDTKHQNDLNNYLLF